MTERQKWMLAVALLAVALIGSCAISARERHKTKIAEDNVTAVLDQAQTVYAAKDSTIQATSKLLFQAEVGRDYFKQRGDSLGGIVAALKARNASHVQAIQELHVAVDSLTKHSLTLERDLLALARDSTAYRIVHVTTTDTTNAIQMEFYVSVPMDTLKPSEVEWAKATVPDLFLVPMFACNDQKAPVFAVQCPAWAHITLGKGQVDPRVCNPKGPGVAVSLFKPTVGTSVWAGLGLLAGYLLWH
jgi:hypothetical protein